MRKVLLVFLCLILGLPAAASCRPTEPVYPLEPQVLILSPSVDSTFAAGPVTVKVFVENIELVDKAGQDNVPGEGHLIYYLDVAPPVEMGQTAIPSSGDYVVSTETSYTWPDLSQGEHVLAVQVVNNDNTPIRYPSAVGVNITVK